MSHRRTSLAGFTLVAAILGARAVEAQKYPPPVRLEWPKASNLINTGMLRLSVGEEYQLSITGYRADGTYADLKDEYPAKWEVSDPKVVSLVRGDYAHIVDVKGAGDGTARITVRTPNGLVLVLPVVVGKAKALDVAADFPPEHRIGSVKISGAPSQLGTGTLRLGVGEQANIGVEALLAASKLRGNLAIYPTTWVSSNPKVVKVTGTSDEGGLATAVGTGNGSATITASVQGVKHTIPVRVGTARAQQASGGGTTTAPFPVDVEPRPDVVSADGPVVVRAPQAFGAKTFVLERSAPVDASAFVSAGTTFRMERGSIVMSDSSAAEGTPLLYRVTALDHAGKAIAGEVVASAFGAASIAGLKATRGTGGVTLAWTGAPGTSYRVARFAPDGSGWKLIDVPAGSSTWTDTAAAASTPYRYAVFATDGARVTAVSATVSPK